MNLSIHLVACNSDMMQFRLLVEFSSIGVFHRHLFFADRLFCVYVSSWQIS